MFSEGGRFDLLLCRRCNAVFRGGGGFYGFISCDAEDADVTSCSEGLVLSSLWEVLVSESSVVVSESYFLVS